MLKKYSKKYIPLNMLYGTLIKITNTKKLMIKIGEDTHKFISTKLTSYAALKKINMDRPATFTMTDDEGETEYFVSISLDKYDKALLDTKFEPLLKKQISITYRFKPYSFTPEGEDIVKSGVNVELVSIRKFTVKIERVDAPMLVIHGIADKAAQDAINPGPMNALELQVNAMIKDDVLPIGRPELKRS